MVRLVRRAGSLAGRQPRIAAMAATILVLTAGGWALALDAAAASPALLAAFLLTYGLGLRHGFDADHIAAIDNATRLLASSGRPAVTAGFFFAVGHALAVLIGTLVVVGAIWVLDGTASGVYREIGGMIGTGFAAVFLLALGIINVIAARDIVRAFRAGQDAVAAQAASGGLIARLLAPALRLVRAGWHMLFVGLAFGLGIGSASEVAFLALTGEEARNAGLGLVLLFPLLFLAGMILVDTIDGVIMARAYDWADRDPARKLRYNLVVTLMSGVAALLIGALKLGDFVAALVPLGDLPLAVLAAANDGFTVIGVTLVAAFAVAWAVSGALYRRARPPVAIQANPMGMEFEICS